jgi:exosortase/archaeosortase family protein
VASEALGINVLGALTLAIDVGALAAWAGLGARRRTVSPVWLAVLFTFALPLERIFQRSIGYLLQSVSAAGACGLLSLGDGTVTCLGVRILMNGREALVDLPCSGSRGLIVLLGLFVTCAALTAPSLARVAAGLAITLVSALAANILRVMALAIGLAHPDSVGIDVTAAPWHEGIGVAALVVGAMPILFWARTVPARAGAPRAVGQPARSSPIGRWAALAFPAAALAVLAVPTRPIDVARPMPPLELPARIGATPGEPDTLTAREHDYFTRYGGAAARGRYGANALTLVQTSAPLRHLHAPDECLRGSGYKVRHVGTRFAPVPTATYRAEATDGAVWRVEVTFISSRGELAASVGEAVWRWLHAPGTAWTMIQRITPWDVPDPAFEAAALRALDLPLSEEGFTAAFTDLRQTHGG